MERRLLFDWVLWFAGPSEDLAGISSVTGFSAFNASGEPLFQENKLLECPFEVVSEEDEVLGSVVVDEESVGTLSAGGSLFVEVVFDVVFVSVKFVDEVACSSSMVREGGSSMSSLSIVGAGELLVVVEFVLLMSGALLGRGWKRDGFLISSDSSWSKMSAFPSMKSRSSTNVEAVGYCEIASRDLLSEEKKKWNRKEFLRCRLRKERASSFYIQKMKLAKCGLNGRKNDSVERRKRVRHSITKEISNQNTIQNDVMLMAHSKRLESM